MRTFGRPGRSLAFLYPTNDALRDVNLSLRGGDRMIVSWSWGRINIKVTVSEARVLAAALKDVQSDMVALLHSELQARVQEADKFPN